MEDFFMALADRTRLRILNLMRGEEISVGDLADILAEPQPKISRHLAYLRQSEIVETTREGKWIYYRIAKMKNENTTRIFNEVLNYLANDSQMRSDRERLAHFRRLSGKPPFLLQSISQESKREQGDTSRQEFEPANKKQELAVYLL